jgi:DNA-binding response OmpR family regulator
MKATKIILMGLKITEGDCIMDKSKIKILVVDDEEDIAHFTAKILQYDGFTAFKAMDGAQALAIFEKERPQICLIDVHLGYSKIDGMDVLRKIKATDKNTECIMITRITDKDTIAEAKKLGVKEYLLKPLASEQWLERVHVAVNTLQGGAK